MKVLFIHPAYPNQFTAIAHKLGCMDGFEAAFLTEMGHAGQIQSDAVPIAYFGYTRDGDPDNTCWYITGYEEALRHGKGVADILPTVFETFPADIVIGHASFGTTFYIKEIMDIPVISYVELPGYQMAWCRDEYPVLLEHRLLHASFKNLVFSCAMGSDAVITPSRHAKGFFPDELQHKIHVQMEGFELPKLMPDKAVLKCELGLSQGPVIGFAGRTLEAMRGFDVFASTAKSLKELRPDCQFLALGSEETIYGNEVAYLGGKSFKQHVLDTLDLTDDFFIFKDYQAYEDYHHHLQAMDLILFPQFEGAANWGLFEAMASAVPVIASNRCFIPEVIENGHNGFMVDPYDIDGMVRLCLYLLNDPEHAGQVGLNARKTIQDRFSVSGSVQGYREVIERALTENTPDSCAG